MKEGDNIETDPLRALFNKIKDSLMTEQEALQNNVTDLVWYSAETRVKAKECINWHFRGEVATGKSTLAMVALKKINSEMLMIGEERVRELNRLIFSDQTEFLRWIKSEEENICIQIDEWNEMADTGYNATTETKLFDHWSDIFAQRYIHRVSCSPAGIPDRNCYLILDIEGRDKENMITRCKVTYRDIMSGRECVLGHMDVVVKEVMEEEWYQKYRLKKFRRMELLEKHGQRNIRELEFSMIAMKTYERMSKTEVPIQYDNDMIKAYTEMVTEDEGRIYSILTIMNITGKVKNLVKLRYKKLRLIEKCSRAKTEAEKEFSRAELREVIKIQDELQERMREHAKIYNEWVDIK